MRKLLLVATLAALTVALAASPGAATTASSTRAASVVTSYFSGVTFSNNWQLSPSFARRYDHAVGVNAGWACLPSNTQFQVANFRADGTKINTHRSDYGACSFSYPLTSNGEYARAGCRLITTGSSGVGRSITCWSRWD